MSLAKFADVMLFVWMIYLITMWYNATIFFYLGLYMLCGALYLGFGNKSYLLH